MIIDHKSFWRRSTVKGGEAADISCMTVDLRIPTMHGRSTFGFCRPDRHCLHQTRSALTFSAGRMQGELHLTKNLVTRTSAPCAYFFAYGWQLRINHTCSGLVTPRDSNGYIIPGMQLPRECLTMCALRDIIPLARSQGSPPRTLMIYL